MKVREFIITKYNAAKQINDEIKDVVDWEYAQRKQNNYIQTTLAISKLLTSLDQRSRVRNEHEQNDNEATIIANWNNTLTWLLLNCILDEVKPKINFPESGYGFENFENWKDQQLVMQYLEGYLKTQLVRWEPIYWIELGQKLSIINLEK